MSIRTFGQWIEWLFDRTSESDSSTDEEPEVPFENQISFCNIIFRSPRGCLFGYTDEQLILGFRFMGTDMGPLRLLSESSVQWSVRRNCILAISTLFRDFFSERPLGDTCFMWWEYVFMVASPSLNSFVADPALRDAFILVMREILDIENDNCRMSALHGLGHLAMKYPDRIEPIIEQFIVEKAPLPSRIVDYAIACKHGDIL
jgi:hypothetical protein